MVSLRPTSGSSKTTLNNQGRVRAKSPRISAKIPLSVGVRASVETKNQNEVFARCVGLDYTPHQSGPWPAEFADGPSRGPSHKTELGIPGKVARLRIRRSSLNKDRIDSKRATQLARFLDGFCGLGEKAH